MGRRIGTATVSATGGAAGAATIGLTERLGYTWQLYLPRLPFMNDQFVDFPLYEKWFKGGIGLFGWLDTGFPEWAYTLALCGGGAARLLALVALVQRRSVLVSAGRRSSLMD